MEARAGGYGPQHAVQPIVPAAAAGVGGQISAAQCPRARCLDRVPYWTARSTWVGAAGRGGDVGHFQRKCTKIRPKLFESFSTRWY